MVDCGVGMTKEMRPAARDQDVENVPSILQATALFTDGAARRSCIGNRLGCLAK